MKSFLREFLLTLVLAIVIFFVLQATVQSFVVEGSSMEPSFSEGERVLANKVVYHFHPPERGDVIIFHPPDNGPPDYIKRIIGLPGESVEIKQGTVYIYKNGETYPLDEHTYIKAPPNYSMERQEIPQNEYFVLGDNRNNSNDSHNDWTVLEQDIVGKAWLLMWPPGSWGLVPVYSLPE